MNPSAARYKSNMRRLIKLDEDFSIGFYRYVFEAVKFYYRVQKRKGFQSMQGSQCASIE